MPGTLRLRASDLGIGIAASALAVALAVGAADDPLVALGGACATALLIYLCISPPAGLLLFVATAPWESKLLYPSATLSLVKIVAALMFTAFFVRACVERERLRGSPELWFAVSFLLFVLISLAASSNPAAGLLPAARFFSFVAVTAVIATLVKGLDVVVRVAAVLTLSAAAAAIYGVVGFIDGHLYRAAGPLVQPDDFAFVLATTVPFAVFFIVRGRARILWIVALVALVGGVLASLTRGALVGLAVALVWAVVARRVTAKAIAISTGIMVIAVTVLLAFFGSVFTQRLDQRKRYATGSAAVRTVFWSAALRMWVDHPVVGVGPGRYDEVKLDYLRNLNLPVNHTVSDTDPRVVQIRSVHNAYLQILSEEGPLALIAFSGLLIATYLSFGRAYRLYRRSANRRGQMLASALQASLVVSAANAVFLSVEVQLPFWLLAGLSAVVLRDAVAARTDAQTVA